MTPSTNEKEADPADNVSKLLEEVFEASTQEADLTDLIKTVGDLYDAFNNQGFESSFKNLLKVVLSESRRSVEVRRILCFISECAVTLDNKYKNDYQLQAPAEDIDDIIHPLLKYLFKALTYWSNASCYTIRFRACQFLHMILTYIQDHGIGEIDAATYENISKIIETRRLDVSCNVRAHAVLLAKFFQDPSSVNDPVIAGLCWQLQDDPNPRVRQNIVSIIAACEETIVPITKRFLFDKNPGVRNAALLHICNRISPRSFSTQQRIEILKQCFSDPSELVRKNAEQRLIPVWFRAYKDKLCRFFKDLRLGNGSLENLVFISKLLKVLSKCVKFAQILEEVDLDFDSCLPKSVLTADKVFLWRRFYLLAYKEDKLCRFLPQPEVLIEFISKQFTNSSFEDDQSSIFNELILFVMDIICTTGVEKCGDIFPVILNMMRNPYVAPDVMPYIVTLYMTYAPKEKNFVYEEIMEVIEDLQKLIQLTPIEEKKNILLKSFAIASQVFIEADTMTNSIKDMKDNLIVHYLNSEDLTLKKKAISALSLYCHLDKVEAQISWPLFANAVSISSSGLKNILLKGAFDILNCYGHDMFLDINGNVEEQFNDAVENMLCHLEDNDRERKIVVQGNLKLYLEHFTWSPTILSKLILLYFNPDPYYATMKDIDEFMKLYGKTKPEAECLCKAFMSVINLLFNLNKNSPYYKVNVKRVTLQLMEFAEPLENSKIFKLEENFQDLIVLKLTKKFLKTPWRLPASDLYSIISSIIPKKLEKLLELKEHIKLIVEDLHSSDYQQTNPYSKRSIKQFAAYMKKIQVAIDTAPLVPEIQKKPSPIEKQLFTDSYVDEDSVNSSKEGEICIEASLSPKESSSRASLSLSISSDGGIPENGTDSQLSSKTNALKKTPAPTRTPASRRATVLAKTPAPAKTPRMKKTPAATKTNSVQKYTSSLKTPLHKHMLSTRSEAYDQSEYNIETVDSD